MNLAEKYEELAGQHRWGEALPLIELIVERNPESAASWYQLGVCLSETRRTDEAAAAFEKALALDCENHEYRYRMFRNLYFAGKYEVLLEKFRQHCKTDPALRDEILADELYRELKDKQGFSEFYNGG